MSKWDVGEAELVVRGVEPHEGDELKAFGHWWMVEEVSWLIDDSFLVKVKP